MTPKKIASLRKQIEELRQRGGIKPREMEALARALGRMPHSRGSEPNWVSVEFPDLRPVSIPHHGSRDLNRFTAQAILDQLEIDVERHEAAMGNSGGGNDDD